MKDKSTKGKNTKLMIIYIIYIILILLMIIQRHYDQKANKEYKARMEHEKEELERRVEALEQECKAEELF